MRLLSETEQARCRRLRSADDRASFITAHALERTVLSLHEPTIAPERWQFVRDDRGKPRLAPPFDQTGLAVSVAHTVGAAAVCVVRSASCGVDIERERADFDYLTVARRCMPEREIHDIQRQGVSTFFTCWTLREAVAKLTGDGVEASLRRFEVELGPPLGVRWLEGPRHDSLRVRSYRVGTFVLATAWLG